MKKRLLAMLLCLCMLLSLAACSTGKDANDGKENETTTTDTKDQETTDKAEDTTGEDVTTEGNDEPGLPLCEETEELGVWLTWSNSYVDTPNDLFSVIELEKRTNVHINWSQVDSNEAAEKFGLMIASGDYPDIVSNANSYYTGGASAAVNDGVFIELDDVVANYMPNYNELLHSSEEFFKNATDDSGKIDTLWQVATVNGEVEGEPVWAGYCIRQDWLDDLGLEVPTTIDDWHTVLTAFKENKECEYPLSIPYNGAGFVTSFLSAYGVLPRYYQVDGKVMYGPMEAGYKEWLDLFRQWYAEGLIDPNFPTNNVMFMTDTDIMALGKVGAGIAIDSMTGGTFLQWGMATDEDYWLTATPSPVLNEGDVIYSDFMGREYLNTSLNITSNCENVELAARWLDYQYSEEGYILMNYGIEGDSYYLDENGEPQWSEKILNGYNDMTATDSQKTYSLGTSVLATYCWDTNRKITPDANTAVAADTWNTDLDDWNYNTFAQMTDAEQQQFSTLDTNITTLVEEFTVQYIMGVASEADYENFLNNLTQYGIEECIALKQTALDRFNSK